MYLAARDILRFHVLDDSFNVVTHKIKLLNTIFIRRMHGDFSGRQSEDQPPTARIDVWQFQDVSQESTIGVRVCTVDNRMSTNNHECRPFLLVVSRMRTATSYPFLSK